MRNFQSAEWILFSGSRGWSSEWNFGFRECCECNVSANTAVAIFRGLRYNSSHHEDGNCNVAKRWTSVNMRRGLSSKAKFRWTTEHHEVCVCVPRSLLFLLINGDYDAHEEHIKDEIYAFILPPLLHRESFLNEAVILAGFPPFNLVLLEAKLMRTARV
jgi:hypothetical protein